MAIDLPEFKRMNATGISDQDRGAPEIERSGIFGQTLPAGILATGREEKSVRKGYSLDSASRNKKIR